MNFLDTILNSSIYKILFGSGGVLVAILTIIKLKRKDKNGEKRKNDKGDEAINPEENVNDTPQKSIVDKSEEYETLDFKSEEYYVTFLKTIEEKRKGGDKIEYK